MHKHIKNLFLGISVIILMSCSVPQNIISKVNITKTDKLEDACSQSLSYALPKSVIKVEIETEKVIQKTGPFYKYSQRFLNLDNVITQDNEKWVIKGVKIYTEGVADNTKRYNISASGNNTSAWNINLTSDGVLCGFNNPDGIKIKPRQTINNPIPDIKDINFNNVKLSEDILLKTSSASMARETANMIYQIRANRFDMLSGNIDNPPTDGKAYQLMLNEFNNMEHEFVSMFTGKTIRAIKTQTFSFTPSKDNNKNNTVLCRFSKNKGLVGAMDLSGTPIYIKINTKEFNKLQNNINSNKSSQRNGIYYCLPGEVSVHILDRNIELLSQKVKIAQLGQVVSMPASILEKKGTVVQICPATGALIQITDK